VKKPAKNNVNSAHFDVLIIGAGINGCGLFRELSLQGVNCLLIDRGDMCEGASAASSRLIHGGIKYLETGEFRLVRESAIERNRLLRNAPHMVKPLETVLPVQSWFGGVLPSALRFAGFNAKLRDRGALITEAGLRLYDFYSRKVKALPDHRFFGQQRVKAEYPSFAKGIKAAGLYYEGHITHAERLGLELVQDGMAANPQSAVKTYTRVEQSARKRGLEVRDVLTGETSAVSCEVIVNAGGAWIDGVNAALGINSQHMGGSKGSHLIVDNAALVAALKGRMIYFSTSDGRVNLVYPYFGHALVGSTDVPVKDPDEAICTEDEKAYLLKCVGEIFPGIQITEEQILLTYCGVRPLPRSTGGDIGEVSRDHSIARDILPGTGTPVLSLIGGKWTTFRAFAAQATDTILPLLGKRLMVSTEDMAIGGGKNFPKQGAEDDFIQMLARDTKLTPERARDLFTRYGTTASEVAKSCQGKAAKPVPALNALAIGEVVHLCRQEHVRRLADILLRRTTVAMEGQLNGGAIEDVARIAAAELGWDARRQSAEIEHTRNEMQRRSVDLGQRTRTAA
jgi:glycerol-3-phosphate dehydrogenase